MLRPLILEDWFPDKLLELAVVEDRQLRHDLFGDGGPGIEGYKTFFFYH
jgi:hypothetical protein